jgi:thymidylate kinase
MLILEGTDCVGKTTLAHKLAKRLNMVYQHLGPLPDTWSDEDYIHLASINAVRDRYHLSEVAYSATLKNRSCRIKDVKVLHSTLILKYLAFTIIITADGPVIRDRFDEKRELFTYDEVSLVNETFKLMLYYADFKIHVTTDRPDITDDIVERICSAYERKRKCITEWADTMRNLKL